MIELPEPTVRPDAVDHYVNLLDGNVLPGEALCLTVVRNLSVDEALTRYDAFPGTRRCTLETAGEVSVVSFPDMVPIVLADQVDGCALLVEDNGFHGSTPSVLRRLSEGTVAASAYWNVDFDSSLSLAVDGETVGSFEFALGGDAEDPVLGRFLDGLEFEDPYRMCAAALAFVERVGGVRVTEDWVLAAHPASVLAEPEVFAPRDSLRWLSSVAPDLGVAVRGASGEALRAGARHAAVWACGRAGVDFAEVERLGVGQLAVAGREQHRRALEFRWDVCVGGSSREPRGSGAVLGRVHALGAVFAGLGEDLVEGFAGAACQACQVDRDGWGELLGELRGLLSRD